eukprot:COSAG05_NODE_481_length_9383_cov_6.957777_3_plen_372_part_00
MACCSGRPTRTSAGVRHAAAQVTWATGAGVEDEGEEFFTPPSSPRCAEYSSPTTTGYSETSQATPDEALLLTELRLACMRVGSGVPFRRMATVYGGEEWLLLRYLRVCSGKQRVAKAARLYEETALWRQTHAPLRPEPAPEPEVQPLPSHGMAKPPRPASARDALNQLERSSSVDVACPKPSEAEIRAATAAISSHYLREMHPFSCVPKLGAGVVLISANIELADPGPLNKAGFEDCHAFFVCVMEYVQRLQRLITCTNGRRCVGDVVVLDVEKLGWRHISPTLMHRVLIPILKSWQAHFPETLHKAFVLNAPKIFELIWKVIRPVLSDRVVAKIIIASDSREDELRELLSMPAPEPLPWLMPFAATKVPP